MYMAGTRKRHQGRSPAKRDLYTIVTSLSDGLNIWLAFKRTTFNVCAFCMAARKELILFFEQGIA